jgi:hypothetical protein
VQEVGRQIENNVAFLYVKPMEEFTECIELFPAKCPRAAVPGLDPVFLEEQIHQPRNFFERQVA